MATCIHPGATVSKDSFDNVSSNPADGGGVAGAERSGAPAAPSQQPAKAATGCEPTASQPPAEGLPEKSANEPAGTGDPAIDELVRAYTEQLLSGSRRAPQLEKRRAVHPTLAKAPGATAGGSGNARAGTPRRVPRHRHDPHRTRMVREELTARLPAMRGLANAMTSRALAAHRRRRRVAAAWQYIALSGVVTAIGFCLLLLAI